MIVKEFFKELGSSVKIEKRENEAGIVLTPDIYSQPDIDFDCIFLVEGVEKLMKGNDLDDEEMQKIFNIMNNYTNLIISPGTKYKTVRLPSLCQGTLPLHRYNIISYSLSVLPLPEKKSTFQFYCGDKKFDKKLKKSSIFQWCVRLCASLNEMNFKCTKKIKIPFEYDLNNSEDLEKVVNFLVNPLHYKNKDLIEYLESREEEIDKKMVINIPKIIKNEPTKIRNYEQQAQEIIENLNEVDICNEIISSSKNKKKVVKGATKNAFINSLRKALKIFIQIFQTIDKKIYRKKQ